MKWKGTLDAGKSFESIMTVMDVFPTLASAAGVQCLIQKKFGEETCGQHPKWKKY